MLSWVELTDFLILRKQKISIALDRSHWGAKLVRNGGDICCVSAKETLKQPVYFTVKDPEEIKNLISNLTFLNQVSGNSLKLTNLLTGDSWEQPVDASGKTEFQIAEAPDFLFLRYE